MTCYSRNLLPETDSYCQLTNMSFAFSRDLSGEQLACGRDRGLGEGRGASIHGIKLGWEAEISYDIQARMSF